jgi:RNA recognition motif-containing protein
MTMASSMNNRLYVGNLSFSTKEEVVRHTFAEVGEVTDVHLALERDGGRSRGFAFVTMGTRDAAEKAALQLNNAVVDGRSLRVNEAEERPSQGRGGSGAGPDPRRERY